MNQLVQQLQEQGESKEQRGAAKALEKEVAHYKRLVRELRRGNEDAEMTLARKETEESLSRPVSVVSHIQVKYFVRCAFCFNNFHLIISIETISNSHPAEPHRAVPTATGEASAKDGRGRKADCYQGA